MRNGIVALQRIFRGFLTRAMFECAGTFYLVCQVNFFVVLCGCVVMSLSLKTVSFIHKNF